MHDYMATLQKVWHKKHGTNVSEKNDLRTPGAGLACV